MPTGLTQPLRVEQGSSPLSLCVNRKWFKHSLHIFAREEIILI